jgi:hypothetical protein
LIAFLGIVERGRSAVDPGIYPTDLVRECTLEDVSGKVSTRTRFNESGQPVEEVRTEGAIQTTTVRIWKGDKLISQESAIAAPGKATVHVWNRSEYDESGMLTDFRRGRGDVLENHFTNFRRDSMGRVTSYEYRQGAGDALATRYEYAYEPSGSFRLSEFDSAGVFFHSVDVTLDARGRVAAAKILETDWKTHKPKRTLQAAFQYDAKGRLVEQRTEPYTPESAGAEQELPPGAVIIRYDDDKHTRTTSYTSAEGSLESEVILDGNGNSTGQILRQGNAIAVEMRLDCEMDGHGNWTSCRRVVHGANGDGVTGVWKRTIAYR